MIAQEQLSNDTNELKTLVYQLIGVVEEQKLLIANQNERIEAQALKVEAQSQEIKALYQKNEEQSQKINAQAQKNEEQAQRIDELTCQIAVLKRHRFGKRSEKLKADENEETTHANHNETADVNDGTTDTVDSPDAHASSWFFINGKA